MPTAPRRFLPPRLALLAVFAAATLARAADSRVTWVRAKADYVEVLSDAPQRDATEFAVRYSAYRQVLVAMFGAAAEKLPPTTVLLFRDNRLIETLSPGPKKKDFESISHRAEVDGAVLLAQSLGGERDRALQSAFEFETMWALARMGHHLPLWAAQGTGRVFATIKLRGRTCVLGFHESAAVEPWTRDPLPWERFVRINQRSPEYGEPRKLEIYLSQAQTLMHRIWFVDERGGERFAELAALLRRTPDLAAIEAALGIAAKDLTAQLTRHARRSPRERELPLDEAALRARMETGAAPPLLVALQLANLHLGANQHDAADRQLAAAQALAPAAPVVLEALARRELQRGDRRRAVELYREAIGQGSVNPRAFLASANHRLDQTMSGGADQAGQGGVFADESAAELRRLLAIHPGHEGAYAALGRALYLRPDLTDEHVKELAPGIAAGDATGRVRFQRALLLERLRRFADARADLLALKEAPLADPVLAAQMRPRLGDLAFRETVDQANELAEAGRFAEARKLIADRRTAPEAAVRQASFEKLANWLETQEARNRPRP